MTVQNGDTVYVCLLYHPPRTGHYGDEGSWVVSGVVEDEEDAEMWVEEDSVYHKYTSSTLGVVDGY